MMQNGALNSNFKFGYEINNNNYLLKITVPAYYVNNLYKHLLMSHKNETQTYGFLQGQTPLYYIENNFKVNILEHLKEFFFIHCVVNYLYNSLINNKIPFFYDPSLVDIIIQPNNDAHFIFSVSTYIIEDISKWKRINFKAPDRKKYKDIDKQVEYFLKEELEINNNYINSEKYGKISFGDWVCFELSLIDKDNNHIMSGHKDELWVRITDEEAEKEVQDIFLGKSIGDIFINNSLYFQEYISPDLDINYSFQVYIKDHISMSYISIDQFKHHFKIKSQKDLHTKLIEIFSFRNDISQRRETVELLFKILFRHYLIILPYKFIDLQKNVILNQIHNNPDYLVYKSKSDFKDKLRQLAERQLKETVLIDSIAYSENIVVDHNDIVAYLNLIKKIRTKEFIHFEAPIVKINGKDMPIPSSILKLNCLREKTLNYIINYLTGK